MFCLRPLQPLLLCGLEWKVGAGPRAGILNGVESRPQGYRFVRKANEDWRGFVRVRAAAKP